MWVHVLVQALGKQGAVAALLLGRLGAQQDAAQLVRTHWQLWVDGRKDGF